MGSSTFAGLEVGTVIGTHQGTFVKTGRGTVKELKKDGDGWRVGKTEYRLKGAPSFVIRGHLKETAGTVEGPKKPKKAKKADVAPEPKRDMRDKKPTQGDTKACSCKETKHKKPHTPQKKVGAVLTPDGLQNCHANLIDSLRHVVSEYDAMQPYAKRLVEDIKAASRPTPKRKKKDDDVPF